MAHRIYETTTHDFNPVNEYIDEKARLRRTKSTWRYTKALALFLLAFGLFLILAAYAYHIFKKPHPRFIQKDNIQTERLVNNLIEKDKKIKNLKKELDTDNDNQELKDRITQLEKEKKEMEEELNKENEKIVDGKKVIYNETSSKFLKYPKNAQPGEIVVTTGLSWDTTESMMYGEPHSSSWCYIERAGDKGASYWFSEKDKDQTGVLNILGLSKSEAENYEKYCSN